MNKQTGIIVGIVAAIVLIVGVVVTVVIVNKFNDMNDEIQELKEDKKEEKTNSYIYEEIKYNDLIKKIENKDDFILFASRTECPHCIELKPVFEKITKENGLNVYILELDLMNEKEMEKVNSYVDVYLTPTIVFFENGKEVGRIVGFKDEESFLSDLEQNNIIKSRTVTVPDVSGKTKKEAVKIIQDAGFEVTDSVVEVSDDTIEEGLVVKTSPPAGAKRAKGQKITLYISTGDSRITVEDYTGKNYLQVKGTLEERGIYVYVEKKEVKDSKKYEPGQIIDQSVKPGEKLGAKDSITLYIPRVDETYPDFTDGTYNGKTEKIQEYCDEHGVTLVIEEVPSSSYKPGTIISQSRPAGSTVASGTTLKIKVAVKGTGSVSENEDEDCGGMC